MATKAKEHSLKEIAHERWAIMQETASNLIELDKQYNTAKEAYETFTGQSLYYRGVGFVNEPQLPEVIYSPNQLETCMVSMRDFNNEANKLGEEMMDLKTKIEKAAYEFYKVAISGSWVKCGEQIVTIRKVDGNYEWEIK